MNEYNRTANPAMPSKRAPSSQSQRGMAEKQTRAQQQTAPGPLRKFLRTPKGTVLWLLLALMLLAALHSSDRPGIANVIAATFTASMIDLFVAIIRKNKRVFPDGGIITGVIVGLVLSGTVNWQVAAITAAIAVGSKHILKIKRKPIFNPAAFALLFALLVFHTGQSWWGDLADIPVYFLPLLVAGGYLITNKVNKFPQVMTYLGTYFLLMTLAASLHFGNAAFTPGDAMRVPLVNAALFLVFFMLTDPPTSPGKYGDQVTFSVIAAVVSVALYLVFGGLSYLFIGLLVANAYKAVKSLSFSS
jgi:Na+-translocating ferredoxin:NAD+ oxidoreductase RnfD subunit